MVDTQDRIKHVAEQKRSQILANVRARLEDFPDDQMAAVADPAGLSERMARMLPPVEGEFGRLIGPVYSTKALEAMWDITRAAISKKAKEKKLFVLKVSGSSLFPMFQFNGTEVRKDILEIVNFMEESGADSWTIAAWLCTPMVLDESNKKPIELLDTDQKELVFAAARSVVERWNA